MAAAPVVVDATHNILFTLEKTPEKWHADFKKSDLGDLTGYQEAEGTAARREIKKHCAETGRGLFHPKASGNPISWDKTVFTSVVKVEGVAFQGVVEAHLGAQAMGVNAKFNPGRDFTYIGLQHKDGRKILRINVHPVAGGTQLESNPENTDAPATDAWKDWAVGQYWLDVISFVAHEMSRQAVGDAKTRKSFWDAILIGGDYNAALNNTERWYYPGAMLPALFQDDKIQAGLDHLQATYGSDVVAGKRWSVTGNTDHKINFQKWTLKTVVDFPRQ